jgi:hypothetical protein
MKQQQEIKRHRAKLSYFQRAEKAKVDKEKYAAVTNKQGHVADTAQKNNNNQPKDVRSKKEIFMERVHKMMDSDPVFNKMGKKKQAQTMVDAIYCDKMLSGENKEAMLHIAKKHYIKHVFPSHHALEHMDYLPVLSLCEKWRYQSCQF